MARGTQLGTLVTMLRAEIGASTKSSLGLNTVETHKLRLAREQRRLYIDNDWPVLFGPHDVQLQAGERYYDLPVDPESIEKAEMKWGGIWHPVMYGIGAEQYNARDPDLDQRVDPVERWQFYNADDVDPGDPVQFEVWPTAATDYNATSGDGTMRFWGKRALPALIADSDRAILDDDLLVLYAAATLITDEAKAKSKLGEANTHYAVLRKRQRKRRMFILGGEGGESKPYRPGPVRVAYTLNRTP